MTPQESNTLHLSKDGNDDAAEYLAAKTEGETVEMLVTGQVREITDVGAIIDIISAEPTDYEGAEESYPDDEAEAALINEILPPPA